MSLNKNRQKEKKARDIICKALKDLEGDQIIIPDFSEYNIRENEFNNKLTRPNIDAGIRAFTLVTNLYGSDGDIDLYSLLHHYLLDSDLRTQLNAVLKTKYN